MATIRELTARLNMKFDKRGFTKLNKSVGGAVGSLKKLGGLLIGGVVIRGLTSFISNIIKAGDEVDKTSRSIGINREAFQEWSFAASLAGVESTAFALSLRKLQKNAVDAAGGSTEMAEDFQRLGISVKDTNGQFKSAEQLINEVADGMGRLETDTERVGIAQNLLGRNGPKLLTLFADGADGIAKMREEARELGGVFSEEFVDASVELVDDLTRLDFAMQGVKNTIARVLLPVIDRTVNTLTSWVKAWIKLDRQTNITKAILTVFGAAIIALGIKMTLAFAGPILIFLKFAAVVAIVVLIVEDLITLFTGGESAIGHFIDAIFGPGSATAAVNALKEAGEGMVLFYENEVVPAMNAVGAALSDAIKLTGLAWDQTISDIAESGDFLADSFDAVFDRMTAGFKDMVADFNAGLDVLKKTFPAVAKLLGVELGPIAGRSVDVDDALAANARRAPRGPRTRRATGRSVGAGVTGTRPRGSRARPAARSTGTRSGRLAGRDRAAAGTPGRFGTVPARGGAAITQTNTVSIQVDASNSGSPEAVGAAVRKHVSEALRQQNREALEAVGTEVD